MSGAVPDESIETKYMAKLVRQYQTHSHSNYCRHNHSCRFGFPKAPSPHTVICRELDDSDDRYTILKAAHVILGA